MSQDQGVPPQAGSGHSAEPEPCSTVSAETASVPNAVARELLARRFERSTFETLPWTVRNAPRDSLAELVAVALDALTDALTEICNVDYFEGNGETLIEWCFASAIEAAEDGETAVGAAETPDRPSPSPASQGDGDG